MRSAGADHLNRYLPHVAVATLAVLGFPALASSAVQAATPLPALACVALAVALSVAMAGAGAAFWLRRPGSRDLVFADLMVWGWLRRVRSERRLAEAERVLGGGELSADHRVEVLRQLAASLEARDPYTHGHSSRVTRHAELIARGMGLPRELVAKVRTAAAVHDVGKVYTPREVLMKPGRLSDAEFAVIKLHPGDGAAMVVELGDPEITAMVRHHHERLDGSGYPDGLAGDAVPLGARIIAVADTFDAMTSSRPYRSACSHKRAMDTLIEEAGTKLDADAVAAFRSSYSRRAPVAWGALLVAAPHRLVSWAGGALQGGAAPLASSLGAAALLGGSMAGPTAPGEAHPEARESRPAVAAATSGEARGAPALARDAAAAARRGSSPGRARDVAPRRGPASRPRFRPRTPIPASPSQPGRQEQPVTAPPQRPEDPPSVPKEPPQPPQPPRPQLPELPLPREVPRQLPQLPSTDDLPRVELPLPVPLPELEVPRGLVDKANQALPGALP